VIGDGVFFQFVWPLAFDKADKINRNNTALVNELEERVLSVGTRLRRRRR
jgi:hypothetical protein